MVRPRTLLPAWLALAAGTSVQPTSVETHSLCKTFYARRPAVSSVKTISHTHTITRRPPFIITMNPVITRTPDAVTVTTTATETETTTADTGTDVVIITTTETDSVTTTATTTSTTIDISVDVVTLPVMTSTSEVPTNFIFPTATAGGTKRGLNRHEHARRSLKALHHLQGELKTNQRFMEEDHKSAYRVICRTTVEFVIPITITQFEGPFKTTFAHTPTVTDTVSSTSTVTSPPNGSITLTITESATTTVTETSTETDVISTTVTASYQPTETYYEQCGPQNQVSRNANDGQLTLQQYNGDNNQLFNTPDAYACCVACINTPNCAGSNYVANYYSVGQSCGLNIFDTCPTDQSLVAGIYVNSNVVPNVLSNGPCGYYKDGDS